MAAERQPTPFAEVNAALAWFAAELAALLGARLVGMYCVGSLALGDFDPEHSDLDLLIVTAGPLDEQQIAGLRAMHQRFAAGESPWACRIEAVYVPQAALPPAPPAGEHPQLEQGAGLALAPLESGWAAQCWTLRERGVAVSGPDPLTLVGPLAPADLRPGAAAIAREWADAARDDPSWRDWVRERPHQRFVIQTLCRMLYSLATGAVASKPQAAAWALRTAGEPWAGLVREALAAPLAAPLSQRELDDTIAFIRHVRAVAG